MARRMHFQTAMQPSWSVCDAGAAAKHHPEGQRWLRQAHRSQTRPVIGCQVLDHLLQHRIVCRTRFGRSAGSTLLVPPNMSDQCTAQVILRRRRREVVGGYGTSALECFPHRVRDQAVHLLLLGFKIHRLLEEIEDLLDGGWSGEPPEVVGCLIDEDLLAGAVLELVKVLYLQAGGYSLARSWSFPGFQSFEHPPGEVRSAILGADRPESEPLLRPGGAIHRLPIAECFPLVGAEGAEADGPIRHQLHNARPELLPLCHVCRRTGFGAEPRSSRVSRQPEPLDPSVPISFGVCGSSSHWVGARTRYSFDGANRAPRASPDRYSLTARPVLRNGYAKSVATRGPVALVIGRSQTM